MMHIPWRASASVIAAAGMIWWLAEFILAPFLFPTKKQPPLEAPAARGLMPAESTSFSGYYRRLRAQGLNPIEAAREVLVYKGRGR